MALGRKTRETDIRSMGSPESQHLEYSPALVPGLEGFRAVQAAAGDGISLVLSTKGELRAWGSLKVEFIASVDVCSLSHSFPDIRRSLGF